MGVGKTFKGIIVEELTVTVKCRSAYFILHEYFVYKHGKE
jgi:hypothetical protein